MAVAAATKTQLSDLSRACDKLQIMTQDYVQGNPRPSVYVGRFTTAEITTQIGVVQAAITAVTSAV